MAKAATPVTHSAFEETETVTQWVATTLSLIEAAGSYAASGTEDPNMSAMIRKLKLVTAAFMAALQTIR